jgi:hypothetical protein
MNYLNNLTVNDIEQGPFPLKDILANSLFYPACDNDGGVVRDCNILNRDLGIENFIYCDYAFGEEKLNEAMDTFHGYTVIATRSVKQNDLTPIGWTMKMPPRLNLREYTRYKDAYEKPFAKWIVYERVPEKGDDYGPNRFSLVYIGGEGIATYQAIYWSNKSCPTALAIIQPGHGFGLNWTNFTDPDGYLNWVVANNPSKQMPKHIYFGGIGGEQSYDNFNLVGYKKLRGISNYYDRSMRNSGYVSVYENISLKKVDPRKLLFKPGPGINPPPKSGFFMPTSDF